MFKSSSDFQEFLEQKLGSRNVYFQPPASVMIHYPAFRYELARIDNTNADNIKYLQTKAYTLTYITEDADDPMVDVISKWDFCNFDRWYASDNLNHYVFTIYF